MAIHSTITEEETGRLLIGLDGPALEYMDPETITLVATAMANARGYVPIDPISVLRGTSIQRAYVCYTSYTK